MNNIIKNERYIYTLAVLFSHLISVILAFFVHKLYTFKSNRVGVETWYEFLRFFNSYIFVFISNITLISIQIEFFDIKATIAGALALPCSVLISYFLLSRYTFKA
jgi:putative flippase GtrA